MGEQPANVYLIRHADARPDAEWILAAGDTGVYHDLFLSMRGREQAAALAQRMSATIELHAVYASPSNRATQTAAAIAAPFQLTVETDTRLRETAIAMPEVSFLAEAERVSTIRAYLDHLAVVAMRDGTWSIAFPNTEPGAQVRERMRAGVDAIAARHPGQNVAVVSHAGSINAFVAELLGIERDFFFPTGNTSLTLVRYSNDGRSLVRLNDTAHLERVRA